MLGARSVVCAGCVLSAGCVLGARSVVCAGCVLSAGCVLGARSVCWVLGVCVRC